MSNKIEKGDIVKPVHCDRSKYMGSDFKEWIDQNVNNTFLVESKINTSCRLKRIGFVITEEFLRKVD